MSSPAEKLNEPVQPPEPARPGAGDEGDLRLIAELETTRRLNDAAPYRDVRAALGAAYYLEGREVEGHCPELFNCPPGLDDLDVVLQASRVVRLVRDVLPLNHLVVLEARLLQPYTAEIEARKKLFMHALAGAVYEATNRIPNRAWIDDVIREWARLPVSLADLAWAGRLGKHPATIQRWRRGSKKRIGAQVFLEDEGRAAIASLVMPMFRRGLIARAW